MKKSVYFLALVVMVLSTLFGCAGKQPQVSIADEGEKNISINASNFKFEPNNISASIGDTVMLKITNVSDSAHNFTIKDPGGNILKSVDLPAKQTETLAISFTENGEYDFYCDKPFHPTMGMRGSIKVGARR